MGEVDEETICNYAPLKNFYAKWASWTADNLFAFTASRRRRTTNSSSDEENALVIITDKNSFSFNDCTIEGFLFQLSCTQKKILFTEIFFFSSAFPSVARSRRDCLSKLFCACRSQFAIHFYSRRSPSFEQASDFPPASIMTYFSFEYLPLKCTFAQRLHRASVTHRNRIYFHFALLSRSPFILAHPSVFNFHQRFGLMCF